MTDIRLVEYDPFWPEDFAARRRVIAGLLAPLIADIQHVGSTAVPGLAAKPKIDIDAVLQSEGDIPVALESAATAGYHFHGDPYGNGLWTLTMSGAPYGTRLYICGPDNHAHQARILFRDYLRRHTGVARQYELLKRKLIIQAERQLGHLRQRKERVHRRRPASGSKRKSPAVSSGAFLKRNNPEITRRSKQRCRRRRYGHLRG